MTKNNNIRIADNCQAAGICLIDFTVHINPFAKRRKDFSSMC
jgi:hypothetical protein